MDAFDSEITIDANRTVFINETITATFNEERHGIYRYIPTKQSGFELGEITMDDLPIAVETMYENDNIILRIGDADQTITGSHVYRISYSMDRVIRFWDDRDELYWNVTGNDWEVPVGSVRATITTPDGVQEFVDLSCYTGPMGSTAQDCTKSSSANTATFTSSGEYLTVSISVPKGFIDEPSLWQKFLWILQEFWVVGLSLLVLFGTVISWVKYGRDPRMGSIIAEYEPPKGMSAGYAGVLARQGTVPGGFFTAMIIELAVKGYLHIRVDEQKTFSRKVTLLKKKEPTGLDDAYTHLFACLFPEVKTERTLVDLKGAVKTSDVQIIKKAIMAQMEKDEIYVKGSRTRSLIFIFLGFAVFALGASLTLPGSILNGFIVIGVSVLIFIFGALMPQRTEGGVEIVRKVLGFKLFMHTAERYRSQWQETQQIFEEYLPYAIAFGHAKKWAKTFKDLVFTDPTWYSSSTAHFTSSSLFTTDLLSTATSINTSAFPAQSQGTGSGSSGGGSSGGGSGGGGGGSW